MPAFKGSRTWAWLVGHPPSSGHPPPPGPSPRGKLSVIRGDRSGVSWLALCLTGWVSPVTTVTVLSSSPSSIRTHSALCQHVLVSMTTRSIFTEQMVLPLPGGFPAGIVLGFQDTPLHLGRRKEVVSFHRMDSDKRQAEREHLEQNPHSALKWQRERMADGGSCRGATAPLGVQLIQASPLPPGEQTASPCPGVRSTCPRMGL